MALHHYELRPGVPMEVAKILAIDEYIEYLATIGFQKIDFQDDILRMALMAISEVKRNMTAGDVIHLLISGKIKGMVLDDMEDETLKYYWGQVYPMFPMKLHYEFNDLFLYLIETAVEKIEKEDFHCEDNIQKFVYYLMKEEKYIKYENLFEEKMAPDLLRCVKKYRLRALFESNAKK